VCTCLAYCNLICTLLLLLLQKAASHGFFVNLDAVLLKLCGPFLDPGSGVFWKRVDPSYVTLGDRLNFKEVGQQYRGFGGLPLTPQFSKVTSVCGLMLWWGWGWWCLHGGLLTL
jgi:hypothetical protein